MLTNKKPLAWKESLKQIAPLRQRQDSLKDQLTDLITIAQHFGLYDAADFIKTNLKK